MVVDVFVGFKAREAPPTAIPSPVGRLSIKIAHSPPVDGDMIGGEAATTARSQRADLVSSELELFFRHKGFGSRWVTGWWVLGILPALKGRPSIARGDNPWI
ncbi:MAG TPA: hypothetical protein VFT74_16175, partial [Isosphaeraceae bacterium]|nr:hypothetical protein [Isosphaeraceae bacterium]